MERWDKTNCSFEQISLGDPMLDKLFKRFVNEKTFLANVSPKTVRFYQQSYNAFKRTVREQLPDRFLLKDFVIKL